MTADYRRAWEVEVQCLTERISQSSKYDILKMLAQPYPSLYTL